MSYLNQIKSIMEETLARPEFDTKVASDGSSWISSKQEDLGLFVTLNNRFRNEMGIDYMLTFDQLANNRKNVRINVTPKMIHKILKRKKCFVRAKALEFAKDLYAVKYGRVLGLIGGYQLAPASNAYLKWVCDDINYHGRKLIATGARLLSGPESAMPFKHNGYTHSYAMQYVEARVLGHNSITVRVKRDGYITDNVFTQLNSMFGAMSSVVSITPSRNANTFILEFAMPDQKPKADLDDLIIDSVTNETNGVESIEETLISKLRAEVKELDSAILIKKEVFAKAKEDVSKCVTRRERMVLAINALLGRED